MLSQKVIYAVSLIFKNIIYKPLKVIFVFFNSFI